MVGSIRGKDIFVLIFLLILFVFFVFIYSYLHRSEKEIFEKIEHDKIVEYTYILSNISHHLMKDHGLISKKMFFDYFKNPLHRKQCVHMLQAIVTKNTKFFYILQKDKKGRFRFLLDASKEDIAPFWQKFDVGGAAYERLYRTRKPQVIHEPDAKEIYLTLLYPIVSANGQILAIFSMDINMGIKQEISSLISPIKNYFIIFIALMLLIVLIAGIHIIYYIRSKEKIYFDPLTKVFNRNYLNDIVANLNLNDYALAIIDIDRFKAINDTYGHDAGDKVLTKTVAYIKENIRKNDILVRYGGDEFLLFVYTRGDDTVILHTCERIKERIKTATYTYHQFELSVSLSIGIEFHPAEYKNIQRAIKEADTLLYQSKAGGRNLITVKKPSKRGSIKDLTFVKDALNDNRVICHYQPIFTLDGATDKYEALVRILSADGTGTILPGAFLPQIKYTNVYAKLTKRVLQIVFDTFEKGTHHVSVNLGYQDIMNKKIFHFLLEGLESRPELARRVTLEILESDEITDHQAFRRKINRLKKSGCRIAIDDFGSGYANFKYIIELNADYLKIDGSLVKTIDTNKKSRQVIENIITFAHNTGLEVIGEFVHSKKIFDILEDLGVDYVQGYYFSPPKPPEELGINSLS